MAGPDVEPSDEALAEKAREGDEDAFRTLYERHEPLLRRTIHRRLSGIIRRKVAESDVIQMAYLGVHQSLDRFSNRGRGSFKAWLEQIVEHRVQDVVRRYAATRKRSVDREVTASRPVDPARFPGTQPTPSAVAVGEELKRAVAEAVEKLPPDQRHVLELVQGEGLTLAEAGERLGRSAGAAKQLYARAIGKLRSMVCGKEGARG
jgi:RNA polymerase sigma-70 factor (ECF subfamily)